MGTYYSLTVDSRRLISDEDRKDSGRHRSIEFTEHGCSFTASAGRIFFVQEYLRAAGWVGVGAHCEDHHEGPSPVQGYKSVSLDEMVRLALLETPAVTLVVGEANLHGCVHESPCGPNLVSHRCGWAETSPVDRAVCEHCPHARGFTTVQGAVLKWDAVFCAHPEAYRNLLTGGALTPGAPSA